MINTESPAVTVDIGSMLKTIQKANVSINCQVAGKKLFSPARVPLAINLWGILC